MDDGGVGATRRTVLRSAAGLGTAALGTAALGTAALTGCGRPTAPGPTTPAAPDPTAVDPEAFAPGVPPTATAGTGAAGTVLGPADAVPVGGGLVYTPLAVVVTRSSAGRFDGFSAICPHDGCLVSQVAEGTIVCPCHDSRFRLDGTVARGPATSPLVTRPVRVDGGRLVLD